MTFFIRMAAMLVATTTLTACGERALPPEVTDAPLAAAAAARSFDPAMVFPADRSLARPEDGVLLADGRLVVTDQAEGLRLVSADGMSRPFGRLAAAGYRHAPPEQVGGANGVSLEPSGTHLLVTDVYAGAIYRVDVASEDTVLVYQHAYGVNMARGDSAGGIWFTQSTRNTPADGEAGLWRAVDFPVADGALCYLPPGAAAGGQAATCPVEGLLFANGLDLDEQAGSIYVAETHGNRVSRFSVDRANGSVADRRVVIELPTPDNIELGPDKRLWIASPLRNEIVAVDLTSGAATSMFRITNAASEQRVPEIERRLQAGESWLGLFTPEFWEPAPGAITGMIIRPDGQLAYVTGLGDAILRLEP